MHRRASLLAVAGLIASYGLITPHAAADTRTSIEGTYRRLVFDQFGDHPDREVDVVQTDQGAITLPAGAVPDNTRGGSPLSVQGTLGPDGRSFANATVEVQPSVSAAAATTGTLKLLVITANAPFGPGTQSTLAAELTKNQAFYQEASYGQASVIATVVPTAVMFTPPAGNLCTDFPALDQYHALAIQGSGFNASDYNSVMVISDDFQGCGWAGLADINGSTIWMGQSSTALRVISHEFGHNLGLTHAYTLDCSDGASFGQGQPVTLAPPAGCKSNEYSDWFDAMGAGFSGAGHFGAVEKQELNWMAPGRQRTVGGAATVTLAPFEALSATSPQSIMLRSTNGFRFFLEYRTAVGQDQFIDSGSAQPKLAGVGVQMRFRQTSTSSLLLDGTPGALDNNGMFGDGPVAGPLPEADDFSDAPLTVGVTYSFPSIAPGVSVKVVSVTPQAATLEVTGALFAPTAPILGAVASGDASASIAFSAPTDDFGNAVSSYTVTAVPAGGGTTLTASGAGSPIVVGGMKNGTAYAMSVKATNGGGASPASSSATALPVAVNGTLSTFTPTRVLDTRSGSPLATNAVRSVSLASLVGGDVRALRSVAVNLTATDATGAGYLTLYPCAQGVGATSTVNFDAGQTVANAATVDVDATGQLCVSAYAGNGTVNAIMDVTGTYSGPAGTTNGRFHALTQPQRLLDTRTTGDKVTSTIRSLAVTSVAGIPSNASAVTLNITATEPDGPGFVTAFPCGGSVPGTSTLNYRAGETVPNAATVGVGAGAVCFSSLVPTHLIVDVTGWYDASATGATFTGVKPDRILDTRTSGTPVSAGAIIEVPVAGRSGVPNSATAAVLNLTSADSSNPGYLTAFPCGQNPPPTSNVNYRKGQAVGNAVTVGLGGGKVCVFAFTTTQIIVDVTGYFA